MTMRRAFHHLLRDTHAAAAAEMALILPMAFALIFTTMEAGYYFQTEHKAIKYVREGARYASRFNFEHFDCSGTGALQDYNGVTAANVTTQVRNVTLTGQVTGGSARIAGWQASDINVGVSCNTTYNTGLYGKLDDGKAPIITVSSRFDYTPILGLLGFNVSSTDVVAQAQAAVGGL